MKKFLLIFMLAIFLGGCGGQKNTGSTGSVEDIKPGEKSVIQPPLPDGQSPGLRIEERNI